MWPECASVRDAADGTMQGLVKIVAENVHVLFLGLCTRKARRKERVDMGIGAGSLGASAASGGGSPGGGCGSPSGAPGLSETEHKLYLEQTVLECKILDADLRHLVDLPTGIDLNEWLATQSIAFFEHANLLYGSVSEFCTTSSCPDMTGPGPRQYLWTDEKGKKVRLSAPQYIDYVMTYAQRTVNDELLFPTKFAREFPPDFQSLVKKILRLIFHLVAHLYHQHFRELLLLGLHGHLNCLFAHLILFSSRFHVIDDKEIEVLHDLVVALKLQPNESSTPTSQPSPSVNTSPSCDVSPLNPQAPPPTPSSQDGAVDVSPGPREAANGSILEPR